MKPLRLKLQEEAKLKQSRLDIIEKDYALSYVLAGIAKESQLSQTLVFKGGTALKKIFFGDYRFSVDLDFSTFKAPKQQSLQDALQKATDISHHLLNDHGRFELTLKRHPERAAHPTGQEAFDVQVKFPWHREALCTIKVEVTHDEPVILNPESRPILHGYGETLDCKLACYHIEEVIAEKLRALLQTHEKLISRGWNKPRARDYYDLWRVLKNYRTTIDIERLITVLDKKCKHRNVSYKTIECFFTPELTQEAQRYWDNTLGNLVVGLPECQKLLDEAKLLISEIIS